MDSFKPYARKVDEMTTKIKLILLGYIGLLSGCASINVGSDINDMHTQLDHHGAIVFTLDMQKKKKTETEDLDAILKFVKVESNGELERYDGMYKPWLIRANREGRILVLLMLEPGRHKLHSVGLSGLTGFLGNPLYEVPVLKEIEVTATRLSYIGGLDVLLRPKADESEFSAGSKIPLLTQANVINKTLDVTIEDGFDRDIALLKRKGV